MKKALIAIAGICTAGLLAWGASQIYNANLVSQTALAFNTTYALNLNTTPNAAGIDRLAAQAVYSSATLTASTFNDGKVSSGNITVASVSNLTASKSTNTITLPSIGTLLAASATNQITVVSTTGIAGISLYFNNGTFNNQLLEGRDWFRTITTTGTAASIASALSGFQSLQVSRSGSVIYATATVTGSAGNSYSLGTSSPAAISTGSTSFSGGHAAALQNAILTVNGQVLKQGYQWFVTDTTSGTAASISSILNYIPGIVSTSAAGVVYATATVAGSAGNSYTMSSSSQGFLTVGGANFSNGRDNATVTINGVTLTQGTSWTAADTTTGTAKAISDAIVANSSLNTIIRSTWTGSVVYATSTAVGTLSNYSLTVAPTASLTRSGAFFTAGANSAINIATDQINITAHGYTTALPVLFSTSGTTLIGLTNQTTYYVIPVDANDIRLATSSSLAQAGTYIDITSSSTTGPHNFTLTPLGITGTASFKWQASNDCTNWYDLSVASVTFPSPYTASSAAWDFGEINYTCVRLNVIAPTTGGLNLVVNVNGKGP